jgi:hypothetical protein
MSICWTCLKMDRGEKAVIIREVKSKMRIDTRV